jgi:osmotically-inducible protein OsmY
MTERESIIAHVRGAIEREARIKLKHGQIRLAVVGDAVVLEGEVGDIATKKLALRAATSVAGVNGIVDRLHVTPAEHRGDGAIRDSVANHLMREPELRNCTVRVRTQGRLETLQKASADTSGEIEVAVEEGIVTLQGVVLSFSHKRIAGVLAWWSPGCRDVINALDIHPPEEDSDDEVVDALRLVWEMDPMIPDPGELRASSSNYEVTLEGVARTEGQRRQAERDAWYVFGVDSVLNRIVVES